MSVPLLPLSAPGGATPSLSPSAASGNQQDEPITAGTGTWNGTLPIFPTFAWYRCAGSNTNSCPTKLSDSRTYTPTATDVGNKLKLVVSAHGLLPTSATEVAYTSVIAAPPGTEPSIKVGKYPTITPNDSGSSPPWGQTYTATVGQWDNSPTSYVIRWQRCDGTCTDIPGAANSGTTSSYTSTHADVGHTLRILVAATGAGGTGVAYGYTTFSIIEKTPVNVDAPRIIGSPYLGLTVSSSAGGWQGYDITYDRQWFACDEPADNACSPIPSASDVTFTPTANLRGSYLRLRVTASNRAGSADDVTVYSAFAGPVADAPPPPPFGAQPPAAGGGGAGAGSDAGGSAGGPGSGSGPPQTFVPFPKTLSLTVPKRLRVGAKLKAPASVAGATSVRYRWLRNGKAIKKATKRAYRVTRRDRGKRIACRLTVSGPAGRAVIVTRAVRIPRRR
jgi:hypothetical protein